MNRAARFGVVAMAMAAAAWLPPAVAACSGGRLFNEPGIGPYEIADVIFTGTVVKRDEPFRLGGGWSSFDRIGWTFVVESVEKGPIVDRIRIESPRADGACGARLRFGQRYHVFAYRSGALGSLEAHNADVEQLEPLPESKRPPTEPGALNFATAEAVVPAAGGLVLISGLVWGVWLLVRKAPTTR